MAKKKYRHLNKKGVTPTYLEWVSFRFEAQRAVEEAIETAMEFHAIDNIFRQSAKNLGYKPSYVSLSGKTGGGTGGQSTKPPSSKYPRGRVGYSTFGLHWSEFVWENNELIVGPKGQKDGTTPLKLEEGGTVQIKTWRDRRVIKPSGRKRMDAMTRIYGHNNKWNQNVTNPRFVSQTGYAHTYSQKPKGSYWQLVSASSTIKPRPWYKPAFEKVAPKLEKKVEKQIKARFRDANSPPRAIITEAAARRGYRLEG